MGYLTDVELVERFEYYLIQIEQQLLKGEDVHVLGDALPFCISLNKPGTFQFIHLNKKHAEVSGYCLEKVQEEFEDYIQIIHPETRKSMEEFLPAFYATSPGSKTLSFVQYVKLFGQSDFSPCISFTKPSALPGGKLLWLTASPGDLGKYAEKVEKIVRMDEFKLENFRRFQQLSVRELDVLKLLVNGSNNPQIAECLFIARQTVETHRKNIKRKLNLQSYRHLMQYAFAFNLIEL